MIRSFDIEVHQNGIVIIPHGFGAARDSKVYTRDQMEDALLNIYRLCSEWKYGDRVKLIRERDILSSDAAI